MITQDLQKKHKEITMNMDEKQKYKLAIQELQNWLAQESKEMANAPDQINDTQGNE